MATKNNEVDLETQEIGDPFANERELLSELMMKSEGHNKRLDGMEWESRVTEFVESGSGESVEILRLHRFANRRNGVIGVVGESRFVAIMRSKKTLVGKFRLADGTVVAFKLEQQPDELSWVGNKARMCKQEGEEGEENWIWHGVQKEPRKISKAITAGYEKIRLRLILQEFNLNPNSFQLTKVLKLHVGFNGLKSSQIVPMQNITSIDPCTGSLYACESRVIKISKHYLDSLLGMQLIFNNVDEQEISCDISLSKIGQKQVAPVFAENELHQVGTLRVSLMMNGGGDWDSSFETEKTLLDPWETVLKC